MEFKQYLSALFYLTEATKYLQEPYKSSVYNQVRLLCAQGFAETEVVGFKIYEQLFANYPDLVRFDKNGLQKTGVRIYFGNNNLTDPSQKPSLYQREQKLGNHEQEEILDLFGGKVILSSSCEDLLDEDGCYCGYWNLKIVTDKTKKFSNQDFEVFNNHLRNFLPDPNLRQVA